MNELGLLVGLGQQEVLTLVRGKSGVVTRRGSVTTTATVAAAAAARTTIGILQKKAILVFPFFPRCIFVLWLRLG